MGALKWLLVAVLTAAIGAVIGVVTQTFGPRCLAGNCFAAPTPTVAVNAAANLSSLRVVAPNPYVTTTYVYREPGACGRNAGPVGTGVLVNAMTDVLLTAIGAGPLAVTWISYDDGSR